MAHLQQLERVNVLTFLFSMQPRCKVSSAVVKWFRQRAT